MSAVTTAIDHLWLSPMNRLLADSPACDEYVYDGAGYSIILPAELDIDSELPLVVLGSGATLRFKNVSIFNSQSLPACLSMRPGAKMLMQISDGVELFPHAPTHLKDPNADLEAVNEAREKQKNESQPAGMFASPAPKPPQQSAHLQVCMPPFLST